jgi:hypothetical protein
MKKTWFLFVIAMSFTWISCYENPLDPIPSPGQQGKFKITGIITYNGEPLDGADLMIKNSFHWKAKSGSDGKFVMDGLTKGEHIFRAEKRFDNSRIVSQELTVIIINDVTDIGEIILPGSLILYQLDDSEAFDTKIKLKWSRSTDEGFIEYKLYRKCDHELSENNGVLIYTTSSPSDTQFTELYVRTGLTHYYRVYAYISGQKMAVSNIEFTEVPDQNLIRNPGFENSANGTFPDVWLQSLSGKPSFQYFSINHENVNSGNNSLKIYYDESTSNPPTGRKPWGGLMQSIPKTYLIEGREYILSLWAKSENGSFQIRLIRNSNLEDAVLSYIVPDKAEWSEQKLTFTVDQSNYYELWVVVRPGFDVGGNVTGYLDDLKILR